VRHAFGLWTGFGRLPLDVRLERLEAARGRPHYWPVMRETAARCSLEGDVVIWASPADGDAHGSQYMVQRSSYLLYPRKVAFAHRLEQLAELRQHRRFSALIAYGVDPPPDVKTSVVYSPAEDYGVVCAPFVELNR
jgi:hypothetical protein